MSEIRRFLIRSYKRQQEQMLQENVSNCDQIKPEEERLQRMQQAVESGKEKKRTTTEPDGGR